MGLCMGISDEIDVATIATDEAKILESKSAVRIAISIKFENVNRAKTIKKPEKIVCCTSRVFVLLIFPFSSSLWGCPELTSQLVRSVIT